MLNVIENQFSPIKVQIILTHFDKDFNVMYDDLYNEWIWVYYELILSVCIDNNNDQNNMNYFLTLPMILWGTTFKTLNLTVLERGLH